MELDRIGFELGSLFTVDEGDVTTSASDISSPGFSHKIAIHPTATPQGSTRHGAGGGMPLGAATDVNLKTASENEPSIGSTGVDCGGSGPIRAGDALRASAPEVRGDDVSVGSPGVSHSGNKGVDPPHATSLPLVAHDAPVTRLADDRDLCDGGVGSFGVPNEEHDVAGTGSSSERDVGHLEEESEGVGLGLSDADLMHAVELLMSSSPLDDEFWQETDACL